MPTTEKSCFVISPIGEVGSPTRDRADLVYEFIITQVLAPQGYKIERADKFSEPGIITNQIIDRVISADLVIADLSERNPNVFYELAIRHVSRKPFVHIISHDEDIPFDNAAVRAIKVDVHDLRSVKAAQDELNQQIQAAMASGARVESPISIALSIQDMRNSGDEDKVALSAVMAEISQLRRSLSDLAINVSFSNKRDFLGTRDYSNILDFTRAFHSAPSNANKAATVRAYLSAIESLRDEGPKSVEPKPPRSTKKDSPPDKED